MSKHKEWSPCCADCRFGNQLDERNHSFMCRRRAPQRHNLDFVVALLLQSIAVSQLKISKRDSEWFDETINHKADAPPVWPTVKAWDWCGEYEALVDESNGQYNAEDLNTLRRSIGHLYGVVKDMEASAKRAREP